MEMTIEQFMWVWVFGCGIVIGLLVTLGVHWLKGLRAPRGFVIEETIKVLNPKELRMRPPRPSPPPRPPPNVVREMPEGKAYCMLADGRLYACDNWGKAALLNWKLVPDVVKRKVYVLAEHVYPTWMSVWCDATKEELEGIEGVVRAELCRYFGSHKWQFYIDPRYDSQEILSEITDRFSAKR